MGTTVGGRSFGRLAATMPSNGVACSGAGADPNDIYVWYDNTDSDGGVQLW